MSQQHPTPAQVIAITKGHKEIPVDRSYLNLAKKEFFKRNNRSATLDDAQALRDIIEEQWYDYYIGKPKREKENRAKSRPVWEYGIRFKIDVYNAMCRFIEHKYNTLWNYRPERTYGIKEWPEKNAGDLKKEMAIEFMDGHIMDNNLLDEWKQFVDANHTKLKKYHKPSYEDYSHLAYNNVTDDF